MNASDSARVLDLNSYSEDFSVISQSWDVFPDQQIKSVRLLDPYRLLVLTESEMTVVRVDNCGKFSNCGQCLRIRDPHCGWDKLSSQCVAKNPSISDKNRDENMIQDVSGGATHLCPTGKLIFFPKSFMTRNECECKMYESTLSVSYTIVKNVTYVMTFP